MLLNVKKRNREYIFLLYFWFQSSFSSVLVFQQFNLSKTFKVCILFVFYFIILLFTYSFALTELYLHLKMWNFNNCLNHKFLLLQIDLKKLKLGTLLHVLYNLNNFQSIIKYCFRNIVYSCELLEMVIIISPIQVQLNFF